MWRHLASNALTFLIVGLFLMVGAIAWGNREYSAAGPLDAAICLKVPAGSPNTDALTDVLLERGVISSKFIYETGARYSGKSGQIKAGQFRVPEMASMEDVIDIVTRGGGNTCGAQVIYRVGINRTLVDVRELDPVSNTFQEIASFNVDDVEVPAEYAEVRADAGATYNIVVAEGVTSWQVANALGQLDVLQADVTDTPPEGTLAPASYEVREGDTVSSVIARMRAAQELNLTEAWENRVEGLPLASAEEALI